MQLTNTLLLTCCLALLLTACSDGSDNPPERVPEYDFSTVDARLQQFLDESDRYDGISVTLVDRLQGTVHEAAFGDHATDIVVMLASVSKVPSASLLMALDDDASLDYDIDAPIERYLPWPGVYGDRTSGQLVSNTSGIPGLASAANYGPHLCQYATAWQLQDCARLIYAWELPDTEPPDTSWDYGGSQWHLAAAVAEVVSNSSWRQAFDDYIAGPCQLEVFQYGNMWEDLTRWNGHPDSLEGLDNPSIEGGAISNLQDYAKLLLMHLNGGVCGETRVLSEESVAAMRVDRGGKHGEPYGLGWWIVPAEDGGEPYLFWDPGAFGSVVWLDTARMIGGFVAIDVYTSIGAPEPIRLVMNDIIPLVAQAVDEARLAAGD